jgi:hypothetical protein
MNRPVINTAGSVLFDYLWKKKYFVLLGFNLGKFVLFFGFDYSRDRDLC